MKVGSCQEVEPEASLAQDTLMRGPDSVLCSLGRKLQVKWAASGWQFGPNDEQPGHIRRQGQGMRSKKLADVNIWRSMGSFTRSLDRVT